MGYPVDASAIALSDAGVCLESPVGGGEAIVTTSGDHTLTQESRALWVGVGGDVKVDMINGAALVIPNVQDGTLLPVRVSKVYQASTTASSIVALW